VYRLYRTAWQAHTTSVELSLAQRRDVCCVLTEAESEGSASGLGSGRYLAQLQLQPQVIHRRVEEGLGEARQEAHLPHRVSANRRRSIVVRR
jgi:hypothetical protein